jgi:hypothetical protein
VPGAAILSGRRYPRRAADTGCCRGVPGHPSKHGANIGSHRSRPIRQGIRIVAMTGYAHHRSEVQFPARRDMLFTMRVWRQLPARLVVPAGSDNRAITLIGRGLRGMPGVITAVRARRSREQRASAAPLYDPGNGRKER